MNLNNEFPKIFIAGHRGMVGSAILRSLKLIENSRLLIKSRSELDLTSQSAVLDFFEKERPDQVYLAAAKVGGIQANNSYPADFIYQNLMIQTNVINAAFRFEVKKLLFLGSSCIYPKLAKQPMSEDALMTGLLEPTNEPYAISKIAGIKLCESYNRQYGTDYRSLMPTNLYGPGDNYDNENSHVIPALIQRFHQAKINNDTNVVIWGDGEPKREFLFVDDMGNACITVMNLNQSKYTKYTRPMLSHINVGTGIEVSIRELAKTIAKVIGYNGQIKFDSSKPNGAPRKLIDSSQIRKMGWNSQLKLEEGLFKTYEDYKKNLIKNNEE